LFVAKFRREFSWFATRSATLLLQISRLVLHQFLL